MLSPFQVASMHVITQGRPDLCCTHKEESVAHALCVSKRLQRSHTREFMTLAFCSPSGLVKESGSCNVQALPPYPGPAFSVHPQN